MMTGIRFMFAPCVGHSSAQVEHVFVTTMRSPRNSELVARAIGGWGHRAGRNLVMPASSGHNPAMYPAIGKEPSFGRVAATVERHVLIVEDDPTIGSLLTSLLEENGYRVILAAEGRQMDR